MVDMGKLLIVCGAVLAGLGVVLVLVGRHGGLPSLPGDIVVERDGSRFVFPLGWSIVLSVGGSILLTLVMRLIQRGQG